MVRKKKTKEKEEFIEEPLEEEEDIIQETYQDAENDEEYIENSLHMAGKIFEQDQTTKQFKHINKDVKIGFFDKFDKMNFHFKSSAYQTYGYITKIIKLSSIELSVNKIKKKSLYDCETKEDLEQYFKNNQKISLWLNVKNEENDDLINTMLNQIKEVKETGLIDEIYGKKENFIASLSEYIKENQINNSVDDIGLLNSMMTITEVSKAYKGNERKAMNTTINITKDVKPEEEAEEEPEDNENSGGIKSFFRGKKK